MHSVRCLRNAPNKKKKNFVTARKDRPKNQKEGQALRFTVEDIVRAIESVQNAGLTIYGVEITLNGSIRINTKSPFKGAVSKPETEHALEKVQPNKKRA